MSNSAYTAACAEGDPAAVTQLFLNSLTRYCQLYARSFLPGRHAGAQLNGRRLLFLLLFPLFLVIQLIHWLCLALDELLFPGYRRTAVKAPVFITGVPRSGTTYLHRALAAEGHFSVFTTWEVLLAPSVLQRRCLRAVAAVDHWLGAPCERLLTAAVRRLGKGLDDIHPVGLSAPEEDYLLLLPAASCFFLLLAFPFDEDLVRLPTPAQLPEGQRQRLLDFYHRLLQRHLHATPGNARLLSKNAAFAGWPVYLLAQYPDASIVVCVRHPDAALESQLKALAPARLAFGIDADGHVTETLFTSLYCNFYLAIDAFVRGASRRNVRVVIQEEMRANSAATLAALRDFVDDAPTSAMPQVSVAAISEEAVAQAAPALTVQARDDSALAVYRQLLASPLRVSAAA